MLLALDKKELFAVEVEKDVVLFAVFHNPLVLVLESV